MIKVSVRKNKGHYDKVSVTGHANSDEHGKDLVCASVSVLAQTLVNAVEALGPVPESHIILEMESGLLKLELEEADVSERVDLLFDHFIIGIQGIEHTYSEYVKLRIEEV